MSSTLKTAREISGFCVVAAVCFSWLFAATCFNRLRIYYNRDQYRPAVFTVEGADFHPADDERTASYWLIGTIEGRNEELTPDFPRHFAPHGAGELLAHYPKGMKINVPYNSKETETIVQGETLRVLHFTPDFWDKESRLRAKLLCLVFIPVSVVLSVYVIFRVLDNRTERRLKSQNGSA